MPHRPIAALSLCLLGLAPSLFPLSGTNLQGERLTLERALELAAQQSEEIALSRLRELRSSAERRQALASVLPALSMSGTFTRRAREVTREVGGETITVQARDAYSAQAVVESTLLDLRAFPALAAADRLVLAAGLESREVRRTVAFEVARSFLAVLAVERLAEAALRRVDVAQQTIRETRLRLEAGLADRNDQTRSELEEAAARLQLTDLERQLSLARLDLEFWIGKRLEGPLAEPELPEPRPRNVTELHEAARRQRSDLKALQERLEAARFAVDAVSRGWLPTLDFRGVYRWTNEAGLSGRQADWNLGLVLSWSLWDGGLREAQSAARQTLAEEIEVELRRLERRALHEIDLALLERDSARAALEQAEVQDRAARANAQEVRVRYREGLASALEQADAQVAAFEASARLARARFQLDSAQLDLARALGQESPLADFEPERSPTSEDPR